jgi:hypothetical protein
MEKQWNIHKEYDWTSVPRGSEYRNAAPYIHIRAYRITSSAALSRIQSYVNLLKAGSADEFYDKLYENVEPADDFFIPYFGDGIRSFSNEFSDTYQNALLGNIDSLFQNAANEILAPIGEFAGLDNMQKLAGQTKDILKGVGNMDKFKKAIGNLGKGVSFNGTAPGSYIETPKLYQYAQNDAPIEITFPLFNTINNDAISKNYDLIDRLTRINRPKRMSAVTMEPPHIYEVRLKGLRYIRWAYCSNFSVNMIGARRMIRDVIIPDGYQISMSLTSLTTEVSNFMDKINIAATYKDAPIVAVNTTGGQFTGGNIA